MITLQKFNKKDVSYILKWFKNFDNRRFQDTKKINRKQALKLITSSKKKKVYAIKLDDLPIGYCMIKNLPDDPSIGITIDRPYWGNGYGKKAMKLLEVEAEKFNVKKLKLTVKEKNIRAVKLYRKLGYRMVNFVMEKEI